MTRKIRLNGTQLQNFQTELDELRAKIMSELGEVDAKYIRKIRRVAQASALAGRSLLMFGVGPISWISGIITLAHAKII